MAKVSTTSSKPANNTANDIDLEDIQSLEAFIEKHPDIATESRLRWWLFTRKANGLESSGAVIKRNGRWFVVVPRMKDWILQAS